MHRLCYHDQPDGSLVGTCTCSGFEVRLPAAPYYRDTVWFTINRHFTAHIQEA